MLTLSLADWLIIIGLALCVLSAIRSIRKQRQKGGCAGCSSCQGCPKADGCVKKESEK